MNKAQHIILPTAALMLALLTGSCSSDGSDDVVQSDMRTDVVTYNGYSSGTASFTYLPRLDGAAVTLTGDIAHEPSATKGKRVLLSYRLPAGTDLTATTSQKVTLRSITAIITDTLRTANSQRVDTMASEHIRLLSIWRTGNYINLHAEVEYTGKKRWLYLLADRATLDSDTIECKLVHNTFGQQAYHWRTAYASYYIGNVWRRQSCKAIRVHLNDEISPSVHTYCFSNQ